MTGKTVLSIANTCHPVQNAAARPALGLSPRDHVSAALQKLHWLPVTHRTQYKLALMMFLVHSHQCPDYMSNTVSLVSDDPGRQRLRSATSTDYHVPRTSSYNQTRRQSVLDRWSENVEQLTTVSPLSWQSSENLNFLFFKLICVYSCNALSARFFAVDRALNLYFMIMIIKSYSEHILFWCLISEVTERILTKLGYIFTYDCYLKNLVRTPPDIYMYPHRLGQKWDRLWTLTEHISATKQDINNREETCQSAGTPLHAP